jgi:dihydroflavonol-4-reductase
VIREDCHERLCVAADLHLRAMTHPAARGERFLAVAGPASSLREAARALRRRLGDAGRHIPTLPLPDWMVRVAARRNATLAPISQQVGTVRSASGAKARRVLG